MSARYTVTVNGSKQTVKADPDTPLLWVLRDNLGLTGSKYGCGVGVCGACTVHVDGEAVRSCMLPISDVGTAKVITIEGLGDATKPHPVQQAWIDAQVPQCGYCQTGFVMTVAAMIATNPKIGQDEVVDGLTNICRCGTYPRMREAIALVTKAGAKS